MGWLGDGVGILLCPLAFYHSLYTVSLLTHCCVLSLAGACVKCSKGVFGAGQACQAMGNLYHDACFTCAACKTPIRNRAFYMEEGAPYCERGMGWNRQGGGAG